MKRIIYFFVLLLVISCGSTKTKQANSDTVYGGPDGVKGRMVEAKEESKTSGISSEEDKTVKLISKGSFSSAERVGEIMNFLASDELNGRDSGTDGIEKAAAYITKAFKENGIKPYFISYRDTLSNIDVHAYNVVGLIEGSDAELKNEYILIGAHYDHIGIRSAVNGDEIANGANDNASGTTTVMELARYFGHSKSNKRSLIFALFSAEERGLLGSKHLAEKLKTKDLNLYAMLNFEMVGVPLVDKDYEVYATGYELSNLADVFNEYANAKLVGFLPQAKEFNLFMRSDNYPFHNELQVPSQTFSTFDFTNFDHYHKVGDEASLMDFEHMASLVNKFIPVIENITNSPVQEIKYN
ncbi:M28 family metallopeptidase [Maribacter sp. HTCC2170]|uniref:M28 family metallopeptidase n=1 Tax=Maribacter sp. (strain HTCC2170 / KCCM 42371) TaxID=313603 RepID=UPI00006B1AE3|nr:M28 family peptidase [Maribacter sp. HTCC2170]EAR00874.1 putative peptidase, M28 family protein [Maribacter sp. HTCC2170]